MGWPTGQSFQGHPANFRYNCYLDNLGRVCYLPCMAVFGLCIIESEILPVLPAHDYLFDADAPNTLSWMRSHLLVVQLCDDCEVEVADPDGDGLGVICMGDKAAMYGDDEGYFMDHGPMDSDPWD